jgi:hypothetical protein
MKFNSSAIYVVCSVSALLLFESMALAAGRPEFKSRFEFKTSGVEKYDQFLKTSKDLIDAIDKADFAFTNVVPNVKAAVAEIYSAIGIAPSGTSNDIGPTVKGLFADLDKAGIAVKIEFTGTKLNFKAVNLRADPAVFGKTDSAIGLIGRALQDVIDIPMSSKAIVDKSKSLVEQGMGLTSSVKSDFTGLAALKLPGVISSLGSAAGQLAKIPERSINLVGAVVKFINDIKSLADTSGATGSAGSSQSSMNGATSGAAGSPDDSGQSENSDALYASDKISFVGGAFEDINSFMSGSNTNIAARRSKSALIEPGWLFIATQPATAAIEIEGREIGRGSAFYESSRTAIVSVLITAEGYKPLKGYVELSENIVRKIKVKLEVIGGSISVIAEPWGSFVKIDGVVAGTTPMTVSGIMPGSHDILIEAPGCHKPFIGLVRIGDVFVVGKDACMRHPAPGRAVPISLPIPAQGVVETGVPEPAKNAEQPTATRADCSKVCDRYVVTVSPENVRNVFRNACLGRCDSLDMPFSVCAWKVQSMNDVQNCMRLPAPN